MSLHRHLVTGLAVVVTIVACRSGTEPLPPGVVIGTWGGDKTELVAGRDDVLLRSDCLGVHFPHPLVVDADGAVILPMAPVVDNGAITGLALIEGSAIADTLKLDIRVGGPYGASLHRVRLVRGQAVDFSDVLCAVSVGS